MRVIVFSSKQWDRTYLGEAFADGPHQLTFVETHLDAATAPLADGHDVACLFVNDHADAAALDALHRSGVRAIVLRCAGFNNVDLAAAERLDVPVLRVPAYSPHSVAEHAVALTLAIMRRVHRAYTRTRDGNFALDGLLGRELHGCTVGVVGTGEIGRVVARIFRGFGCSVLASDPFPDAELAAEPGIDYVPIDELLASSDVITLHCPLTPETYHLVDADAIERMRPGAILINTSRGAVVDAPALIDGIKAERLGGVALDVYEEEGDVFFEDVSSRVLHDDVLARLTSFPNVLITSHQAFFTREAITQIAATTRANVHALAAGDLPERNRVLADAAVAK